MKRTFAGSPAALLWLLFAAAGFSPAAQALSLSDRLGQGWPFMAPAPIEAPPLPLALAESVTLDSDAVAEIVTREAMAMLGAEYALGKSDDGAVDCSSLMQRIFRVAGLLMPRTAREQASLGHPVDADELKKGDLVFYRWQPRNLHVAVYMDDGYILHASPAAGRVVLTRLTPLWEQRMVAARRVI